MQHTYRIQLKQQLLASRILAVLVLFVYVSVVPLPLVHGQQDVNLDLSVNTVIEMSVDSTSIDLGTVLPGSAKTGFTVVTVSTNSENGYQVNAHFSSAGHTNTLRHSDTVTYLLDKPDFDGTAGSTALWSGVGLGFSVYEGTEKNTAIWGTGTTETDANNRYSGFPSAAFPIHSVSTNISNDQTKIGYKVDVASNQKPGSYAGDVTYSAVIIP